MFKSNTLQTQESFIKKYKQDKMLIRISRFFLFIIFFGLWEICAYTKIIDSFIFSSPSRIVTCFIQMSKNGSIFYHIGITLYETILSFAIGTILGIAIAILLWWNEIIAKILEPYLVVLNSLPKTALAPIIIVWLGNTTKSIIFTALTISIVVTILNVYNGFIEVDKEKIKLIYTFNGTKRHVLSKVVFPSNFSNIISTMKVNIGLCLIGVIIGEFLVAKNGLGYLIVYGSQVFKLDWVMMSILILALMATGMYQLIVWIEKKYSRKKA